MSRGETAEPGFGPVRGLLAILALLLLVPAVGRAQAGEDASLDRARDLRASKRYDAAVEVLRTYLGEHPDHAEVRWFLAETLYWAGRPVRARDELRRALQQDPGMEGARDLWYELQELFAPELVLGATHADDSQPLTSTGGELRATVPLTPSLRLVGSSRFRHLDTPREQGTGPGPGGVPGSGGGPERAGGTKGDVVEGALGMAVDPLRLPLSGRLRLGGTTGPVTGEATWIGEAALGVELPADLAVEVRARRWNDRHTAASLDTMLMATTVGAAVSRSDPTGWSGEVGWETTRYPGGNRVRSAHAWILAPLAAGGGSSLRAGYGFSYQDAEETRYVPAGGGSRAPGATGTDGRYDPYYTPEEVRAHSAVVAARIRASSGVDVFADGSVGIHAREWAPAVDGGQVRFSWREFRPWRVRARLAARASPRVEVLAEASLREDAFFRVYRFEAGFRYRFAEEAPRP